jgi:hypothetical protein
VRQCLLRLPPDISRGTLAHQGTNTSNDIVLSPSVQEYSRVEHRAASMACYGEARARVIGHVESNVVIDLSEEVTVPGCATED